jgi:hypothetical protein
LADVEEDVPHQVDYKFLACGHRAIHDSKLHATSMGTDDAHHAPDLQLDTCKTPPSHDVSAYLVTCTEENIVTARYVFFSNLNYVPKVLDSVGSSH